MPVKSALGRGQAKCGYLCTQGPTIAFTVASALEATVAGVLR